MKRIKEFIAEHAQCLQYLPVEQEWEKLPKQWICNIIHSSVENEFADWVKQRIEERNAGIVKEKNLGINIDPEIMRCFMSSNAISSE